MDVTGQLNIVRRYSGTPALRFVLSRLPTPSFHRGTIMITRLALLLPLAAALVGAASTARAQDIQPLDGYQRTVYRELRRYEAEFDFDNPTHHVWVGSLSDDQSQSVTVQLEAGTTYAILGVCDEDCSDVDLSLYAGSTLIDSDVALDDYPIVR